MTLFHRKQQESMAAVFARFCIVFTAVQRDVGGRFAYFSDRGRPFRANRGRDFKVIMDDHGRAGATTVS